MKKLLLIVGLLISACAPVMAERLGWSMPVERKSLPYIEYQAGYIGAGVLSGPTLGIRGGIEHGNWDWSLGYSRAFADLSADNLISDKLDLHTINVEGYYLLPSPLIRLKTKLGGGIGYSIPNLSGGTSEVADNEMSFVLGGGLEYVLDSSWSIGGTVKGFFFHSNTHRTVYTSHLETLSNDQAVEVLDVSHVYDSVNFHSLLATLAIKYSF